MALREAAARFPRSDLFPELEAGPGSRALLSGGHVHRKQTHLDGLEGP